MSDFEKWVDFSPSYDCIRIQPCEHGSPTCKPGGGGSHGIHGVDARFYLRGELGVVQFVVYTGWMRDETPEHAWGKPWAFDLGYHSPAPRYEEQEQWARRDCHVLLGGVTCYYDGSSLQAEEPWRILRSKGSDALWEFLEGYYNGIFTATKENV